MGKKAARHGSRGEQIVWSILNRGNTEKMTNAEWTKLQSQPLAFDERRTYVVTKYRCPLITSENGEKDFFVSMVYRKKPRYFTYDGNRVQFFIEVKNQSASGSCDIKPFYELANVRGGLIDNLMMVFGGIHWQTPPGQRIRRFLDEEAKQLRDVGKHVWLIDEHNFADWVNDHLTWF